MGDLSAHFSRSEFRCRHCGALPSTETLAHLVRHLERLRRLAGQPLRIVSGFRCPEYNRRVGGARRSRHLRGDAADLELGVVTEDMARAAGFKGIGISGGWVRHVDLRPTPARWTYG